MKMKDFQRYLDRDGGHCLHCGTTEGLVPQHRANRGMGGRESLDVPANVIVLCGAFNGLIESDAEAARMAEFYGWKLRDHEFQHRLVLPVFDRFGMLWFFLDDDFHRTVAP